MITHMALDIETVPAADLSEYSETIQEKITQKIERQQERNPDFDFKYFASTHGDFGKIICISLGYILEGEKIKLKSLHGHDEFAILDDGEEGALAVVGHRPQLVGPRPLPEHGFLVDQSGPAIGREFIHRVEVGVDGRLVV